MSDVVPGTLVQMRTLRRFSHYMVGEVIAVPFEAARDLDARRLAQPLQLLVPPARTPPPEAPEAAPEAATPARAQPAGTVRK